MPLCPSCGVDDERVYVGLQKVECPNRKCVEYEASLDTGVSKDKDADITPSTMEQAIQQYLDNGGWP